MNREGVSLLRVPRFDRGGTDASRVRFLCGGSIGMEDVEKNGWDVEGSRRGATAAGTAGVAGDLPPILGAGGGEKGFGHRRRLDPMGRRQEERAWG